MLRPEQRPAYIHAPTASRGATMHRARTRRLALGLLTAAIAMPLALLLGPAIF